MKASFTSIAALALTMGAAQPALGACIDGPSGKVVECSQADLEWIQAESRKGQPATKADIDALTAELDWIKGHLRCLIEKLNATGFTVACESP